MRIGDNAQGESLSHRIQHHLDMVDATSSYARDHRIQRLPVWRVRWAGRVPHWNTRLMGQPEGRASDDQLAPKLLVNFPLSPA